MPVPTRTPTEPRSAEPRAAAPAAAGRRRRTLARTATLTAAVSGALLMPAAVAVADTGVRAPAALVATVPAALDGAASGRHPALLAAGGAMAATGAAGLCFALARHGRAED